MTNLNTNRMRQVQMMNSYDEHPSAAMHRSKIVTAWFDVFTGEIVTLNELYNNRRSPQKKDGKKEKNVSDDLSKILKSECIEPWPTLSFTQVRQILGKKKLMRSLTIFRVVLFPNSSFHML
jgi:hypothetical protein